MNKHLASALPKLTKQSSDFTHEECDALWTHIQHLKASAERAGNDLYLSKQEIVTLTRDNAALRTERDNAVSDLKNLNIRHAETAEHLEREQKALRKLEAAFHERTTELEVMTERHAKNSADVTRMQELCDEAALKIDEVRAERDAARLEVHNTKERCEQLELHAQSDRRAKAEGDNAVKALGKARAERDSAVSHAAMLERRVADMQRQIEEYAKMFGNVGVKYEQSLRQDMADAKVNEAQPACAFKDPDTHLRNCIGIAKHHGVNISFTHNGVKVIINGEV